MKYILSLLISLSVFSAANAQAHAVIAQTVSEVNGDIFTVLLANNEDTGVTYADLRITAPDYEMSWNDCTFSVSGGHGMYPTQVTILLPRGRELMKLTHMGGDRWYAYYGNERLVFDFESLL